MSTRLADDGLPRASPQCLPISYMSSASQSGSAVSVKTMYASRSASM